MSGATNNDDEMAYTSGTLSDGTDAKNSHQRSQNTCGRGIVSDFKNTIGKHWIEEMKNFDQKTVAVSFFLFFACISPAITFGAIYAKATNNWIGAVEMITATAWVGIAYSLTGGQPMMINGGTGPVLAFAEILFKMSESMDVPFLTFNAWIGLWVAFYMILAAFFDLNRIIIYATRFTDEIFAMLIAVIFILNALGSPFSPVGIYYYFESDHKSHDVYEDDPDYSYQATALLSLLVCLGTVQLAFLLRKIKFSPFLPNQAARNVITDFAVVLSIVVMTVIAGTLFSDIELETLNVPNSFAPTFACCTESCESNWPEDCPDVMSPVQRRPWIVDLFDLKGKGWVPFAAAGPAILAFVLVFLDDGITWHLINHPAHKLTHGDAYNYDTLFIGITVAVNSLLGLPWLVAATVRSLNHVHALAEKSPDGKIVSVRETRLTHLMIHLLCLGSIFALELLQLIPMPVLYGVFLFMGLVSLGTNQFWGRILMFFMQPSQYPVEPYTVHVKPKRMHLFTVSQLFLFVLLYVVKSIKTIAIAFPLIIACCIPFRLFFLSRFFTEKDLIMLDSDDDVIKAWLDENTDRNQASNVKKQETKSLLEETEETRRSVSNEDDDADKRLAGTEMAPEGEVGDSTAEEHVPSRTSRRGRRKSLSCPPHMLFAQVSFSATTVEFVEEEEDADDDEEGTDTVSDGNDVLEVSSLQDGEGHGRRPRRRKVKTISCPPHMLFAEAERQVASNYFFG